MATYTSSLAPDNTTLTTFKAWATPISAFFATCGWIQTSDTGQVVWTATVLTLTQVTVGATAVYSYSSYTGPDPRIGMSVTVTGFGTGGNNVTATLTAVSGGASGTVTVALSTQSNETHSGSGTTTALAAVPGTGAYVYEIWKTGDSVGFDVYAKVEYGTNGSFATRASIALSVGTGANGSGSLTNSSTRQTTQSNSSVTTVLPCHLSGDSGRMTLLMFQANTNQVFVFNLERSYDNSGTPTGSYYNYAHIGPNGGSGIQQSLFPTGAGTTTETGGFAAIVVKTATTGNVGSTTCVSQIFPLIGGIGNPLTGIMVYRGHDFSDDQVVYITIYGVQQTYITNDVNSSAIPSNGQSSGYMARYS